MAQKPNELFRRGLAMLLSMAMLLSLVVLPAGATGTGEGQTVAAAAPSLKFELPLDNVNYYEGGETVLVHGNWLNYLADNGNETLKSFLQNEADMYVDLMPADGGTWWNAGNDATNAIPTFNADGTVTITNKVQLDHYWPYVYTEPKIFVNLDLTPYIYFSYTGNADFNLAFYYNGETNDNVSVAVKCNNGVDFPAGDHTGENAYCVNIAEATGLSGKISLDKCLFYCVGGTNEYVTLTDIGFVSSKAAVDRISTDVTGTCMDGYTAVMVEYMGTPKDGQSGAEGAEFFVDAVIDCGVDFDEEPHQMKAKTQFGFMLYIPDKVMNSLAKKPARGDLIDASFPYNTLYDNYKTGTNSMGATLSFYENPAVAPTYASPVDVNANVKLFNYGANMSRDGFNFWNGFWGFGGNAESVDGAGMENGKYQYPTPAVTLTENGYPMMSDDYALDYLFDGTGASESYTMANGGGLFQQDADGYYYYDSMQNAAYYDKDQGKFLLYDDLIVRPWYHTSEGDDFKDGTNFQDYANVNGNPTAYGNFLPFNKVTSENITVDGAVYYNKQSGGSVFPDGNTYYTEIHAVDENFTANRNAAGSLEKFGINNVAADKVLAGTKAMATDAYQEIVAVNGEEILTARLEEKLDMGFGMSVDFDFYMPQSGQVNGEAMEFDFLGDDDVLVYLGIWNGTKYDYKLVLDITGIHEARKGNIDFSTGALVDFPSGNQTARTGRTLKDVFGDEYDQYFDGDTFADFTKLSLKFFYMERGGNISYCRLRFNIPTLPENSLTVGKALDKAVLGSQTYQFRVLKATDEDGDGIFTATDTPFFPEGTEYTITGTNKTGTVGKDGYFQLKPGQSVTFHNVIELSQGSTHYVVEETITQDVDSQFTVESPVCTVNGVAKNVTQIDGACVYQTEALALDTTQSNAQARAEKTQIVGFTNIVDESKLGKLEITKVIAPGANIPADASFNMRVKLGDGLLPKGATYDLIDANTKAVISENVEVTAAGIVTLRANQTAVIEGILATSAFEVTEISYNTSPTYFCESEGASVTRNGVTGTIPLEGTVAVTVRNDDSSGLLVDKTVAGIPGKTDEFILTLEAFATGETSSFTSTTPADIVLVLDQSASMYTPKGANTDSYDRDDVPADINGINGIGKIDIDKLDPNKGSKLGYYVAHTTEARTVDGISYYDWFIVQYVDAVGWVYVRVPNTTTSVSVSTPVKYEKDNGQYYATVYTNDENGSENGIYKPDQDFYYYESQYAALYESVNDFVTQLKNTGVDHRIAVVGFSSPYYDGFEYYDGSGLYIDGTYYLYDSDYRYWGYASSANANSYILYVPNEEYYNSMASVLPAALENIAWTYTAPPSGTELVRLDPNQQNTGATLQGTNGTSYTKGTYFAAHPAGSSLTNYNALTAEQYQQALVSVKNDTASITASVDAVRTNYMQTCPAAGLDMAQKIFAANQEADRDQIMILFTDGVPTVSLDANREKGESANAGVRETNYSGMSGAKDAVNLAKTLKDGGIQIYTIGTSALAANVPLEYRNGQQASAPAHKTINGYTFLEYVSSNYQGVECAHTVTTVDGNNTVLSSSALSFTQNGQQIAGIDQAQAAADSYAKTAMAGDISVAFDQIIQSVSSPNVTLGSEAVLKEYLSDYFDLTNADVSAIKTYVAPYTGTNAAGEHTFGDRVASEDMKVSFSENEGRANTVVNVTGFNYKDHYVRQDPNTNKYLGYKVIVEVPIKTRDGFWGGNNVPTNKYSTAIYDGEGNEVQDFPMPEVNVPVTPVISTNDVTVYYGEPGVTGDKLFDKVTVDGFEVVYDETLNTFVPGNLESDEDDWMDDYASLNWSANSNTLSSTFSGKVPSDDYTFGVTLTPKENMTGETNLSQNPSNMAGDPVDMKGTTVTDDASVDILVPVITYQDSTINLGDKTPDSYYEATNRVDSIKWVNMENPYDATGNAIIGTPSFGTEPTLGFDYDREGTGENYFREDTPIDVTVNLGGENITDKSYFEWVACDSQHHDEEAIAKHKGDVTSKEFWIHVAPITLAEDVVVIDFGLPVNIHVLNNDALNNKGTLAGVKFGSEIPSYTYSLDTAAYSTTVDAVDYTSQEEQGHGKIVVTENNTLLYTPNDMVMSKSEKFVYAAKYENGSVVRYYYSTVTVIPATNIYFEDSFLQFENSTAATGTFGVWSEEYTYTKLPNQAEDRPGEDIGDALGGLDADSVYGYDAAYDNYKTYSLDHARSVTVDKDTGIKNIAPKATFKFTGTGFDVVSLTDGDSGCLWVQVTDQNGKRVKSLVVSNYYGYTYGLCNVTYTFDGTKWNRIVGDLAGEGAVEQVANKPANANVGDSVTAVEYDWGVNPSASGCLYQIPVIKVSGLTYGTYDVEITAVYLASQDMNKTGSYTVWLDAIRIYNPAQNDETANDAYEKDGENNPYLTTVKKLLVAPDGDFTDSVNGSVFVDGKDNGVTLEEYKNQGPNNETYLENGNGIAFKLRSSLTGDSAPVVRLQIGAKLAEGSGAVLTANHGTREEKTFTLLTATNMFYDLGYVQWKAQKVTVNGVSYWESEPILLSCTAENGNILSLTDIKATGANAASIIPMQNVTSEDGSAADGQKLMAVYDGEVASFVKDVYESDSNADQAITLKYPSLSFESEVKYNVYFSVDDSSVVEMGLLTWSSKPQNATVATAENRISGVGYDEATGLYMVRSNGIPAKKLGDDLYLRVYGKRADGSYVYSALTYYNAKLYAADILANSRNADMKALVVAMLNYGAAAQKHFGYKTNDLMNAGLTAQQQALVQPYSSGMVSKPVTPNSAKTVNFKSNGGFSGGYPSVSFEGAFSINYYLTPKYAVDGEMTLYCWDLDTYNSEDVLTEANATAKITMTKNGSRYAGAYTGIAAKQIDETVFVAAVYESNGVRYSSPVISYSLGAYCADQAVNGSATMKMLAQETAVYGSYAKAYFDK